MSFIKKLLEKNNIFEFIRYIFVGGISALVDMGVLYIMTEFAFDGKKDGIALTLSVATGFVFGLIVNYLLSQLLVFTSKEQREKGKKASAFFIYAVVGLIGFVLTELLMHIGMLFVSHEGLWYILLNCFVKGVVLIWNYVGRKIFVYRGE
ncbi:MAG: GtrA family protein [Clostridia bacterium]|nr:GtrA family protein [Clostridia bacterium]